MIKKEVFHTLAQLNGKATLNYHKIEEDKNKLWLKLFVCVCIWFSRSMMILPFAQ